MCSSDLVRPADDILQTIYSAIAARDERRRKYAALRDLPSTTRNQARVSLLMNAGLLIVATTAFLLLLRIARREGTLLQGGD